jgi:hypothetical protein
MALFEFGLPGNNNNNNRMTHYFGTRSINVAFSHPFSSSLSEHLNLFPSSHYPRGFQSTFIFSESHPSFPSSFLLTNVLILMSLFVPIGPPHCCEPFHLGLTYKHLSHLRRSSHLRNPYSCPQRNYLS